jgi:hypothetical protein
MLDVQGSAKTYLLIDDNRIIVASEQVCAVHKVFLSEMSKYLTNEVSCCWSLLMWSIQLSLWSKWIYREVRICLLRHFPLCSRPERLWNQTGALTVNCLYQQSLLANLFLMMPSIVTKFQYVNFPFLFPFSSLCFAPYTPSSGEIYN